MGLIAPLITILVMIPFGIYFHKVVERTVEEYNLKEMNRRVVQMQAINDRLITEVGQLKQRVKHLEQQDKSSS
ncbi:MAG: hypothetical protein Q9P01_11700 [Anaerolineae bacterium]|nr:hypothetical protein [Anaerolineae bacterium]MDQ7035466.1 hypothetical protein [Anaerolineae bacterium]